MTTPKTPIDLLELLQLAHAEWACGDGSVTINGEQRELGLQPVGNGHPDDASCSSFVAFSRAYLKLNPVTSFSYSETGLAVVLGDRRQLPLAAGSTGPEFDVQQTAVYNITGKGGYPKSMGDDSQPITRHQ